MTGRIAVVTTSRADYGLLYCLVHELERARDFRLQLIACGSHLSARFGRTVDEIDVPVAAKVPLLAVDDRPVSAARALAAGTAGFAAVYDRLRPDLIVVLGDRFELLSAASAAVAMRLPLAHIHGGESSEGVLDEQVRHAVTKLSHLHFTTADLHRRRVIAMGEDPRRVFNVGAPGLEYIRRAKPLPRLELELRVGMELSKPFALATYHPDGLGLRGVDAMLRALDALKLPAVLTFANADAGGRAINARLRAYAAKRRGRAVAVASLGHLPYVSLMRRAAVVAGNSSSGLIEAPTLRVPTVNIGPRQDGRLRAPSVLESAPDAAAVASALRRALRLRCTGANPYGDGRTSTRILAALRKAPPAEVLLRKSIRNL